MVKAYAQAIDTLIRARGMRPDDVFGNLRAHLAATGRLKLLPQLARELKVLEERRKAEAPLLEVASEAERAAAEAAARAQGVEAAAQVNPDLVRGWRLRANGAVTDRSAKRSLIELYRAITT